MLGQMCGELALGLRLERPRAAQERREAWFELIVHGSVRSRYVRYDFGGAGGDMPPMISSSWLITASIF